jgi:TP901 family phage tail tape measure protein
MAGAGGIRAGGAYVEIFAKDGQFQQAMARVQSKMQSVAQSLQRFGTGMSLGGAALGAPLVLAAKQAAGFEDALLGMKGAAGLAAEDVLRLANQAKQLGSGMGMSPTTLAQAFLELSKAGMSVDDVLAGAGKSAAEFAKVGGVDAEQAAVFMKAAMNVFGVSAQEAVDTLSAAADSSETSISAMVESFSQVGSAGKAFNQSLFGISQAMVALAKSNIMGEEAGTAIKTMLTKLVAPTDDAQEALAVLGLSMADFRDEAGKMLPMQQIAGVFERALGKMGGNAEELMMSQQALVDVFEQRGIKVITAFANIGEQGFANIAKEMQNALPVSEKFAITMEGISGQFSRLKTGVELISIAFGQAISGGLQTATTALFDMMQWVASLISQFPELAVAVSAVAAGMVALGTAAIAASLAVKGLAAAGAILAALASPAGGIALVVVALAGLAAYMTGAFTDLEEWAMRLKSVWAKLGIWIAAAFDQNFFANGLEAALKKVDDDFARWEANRKAKKEEKPVAPEQAIKPDQNRDPMVGNPLERNRLAAELDAEDSEMEQDAQKAITAQTDAYFKAAEKAKEFGDAGEEASKKYFDGLVRLQRQLKGGILNTTSYNNAAEALGNNFAAELDAVEQLRKSAENGFGQTLGSFGAGGSAGGIGIGPELNPLMDVNKQTAANTAATVQVLQRLADEGRALVGGDKDAAARLRESLAADVAEMQKRATAPALDFAAAGKMPTAGIDVAALADKQAKIAALDAFLGGPAADSVRQSASSATAAASALEQMAGSASAAAAIAPLNTGAAVSGVAAPAVAAAAPAAAAAATDGTQIAAGFLKLGEHMMRLRSTMAVAMATNNQLTAQSNVLLRSVVVNTAKAGAYFS